MKKQGNLYIFIYSSVLVIVVAAVLSFAAINLKPIQDKNVEIEKKQNILTSVNVEAPVNEVQDLFEIYIKEAFLVNIKGEIVEGDAFNVDLKKEYAKPENERALPLFKALINDTTYLIVPLRGKGLWGPIWGYISFIETITETGKSYNKIAGATFDHKGETPGLGAEINKDWFEKPFIGKTIFDENGEFVSIQVVKGGADKSDMHGVDAISGGTITSDGLEDMVKDCLTNYLGYLKNNK